MPSSTAPDPEYRRASAAVPKAPSEFEPDMARILPRNLREEIMEQHA